MRTQLTLSPTPAVGSTEMTRLDFQSDVSLVVSNFWFSFYASVCSVCCGLRLTETVFFLLTGCRKIPGSVYELGVGGVFECLFIIVGA